MNRKNTFIKSILSLCGFALYMQSWGQAYVVDAGRFSQSTFGGTARMQAIGGAQHSLGGDLSTLTGNPAGLGVYNKSEMSITPGLQFGRSTSTYTTPSDVTKTDASRNNFHIANFGFVASSGDKASMRDWKGGTWGISFDRTNDFQRRRRFSGSNSVNNLRSSLAQQAQQYDVAAFDLDNAYYYDLYNSTTALTGTLEGNEAVSDLMNQAYWSDLFYYDQGTNSYETLDAGRPVLQEGEILSKGAQSQWNIAYGNNYRDELYVGGAINVHALRYIEETTYTETSQATDADIFNYSNIRNLEQVGTGVSMKLGLIYRITDYIRLGSAFQTPTWYYINEEFTNQLITRWNVTSPFIGYNNYEYSTRIIEYDYQFRAPMRWTNGLSVFFKKAGFISVDVEYVPYKQAKFSSTDGSFASENAAIKSRYNNVWNIRAGCEFRIKNLFLRGGYALYADPVNSTDNVDRSKHIYTAGLGLRLGDQHIDFTLVNELNSASYSHYQMADDSQPVSKTDFATIKGLFTWGIYID